MDKKEILRQSLIKLMNLGLLNEFTKIVFNYELKDNDNIYIQYKIANDNITINIFDNINENRFNGYVFLDENNDSYIKTRTTDSTSINFIYLKKCKQLYLEDNNQNNLILFSAWLKDENTLDKIFPKKISQVFK